MEDRRSWIRVFSLSGFDFVGDAVSRGVVWLWYLVLSYRRRRLEGGELVVEL